MKMKQEGLCSKWPNRSMREISRLINWSKRYWNIRSVPGWCLKNRWNQELKAQDLILSLMAIARSLRDNQMSAGKYSKKTKSYRQLLMSSMKTWHMASKERTNSCSSCISWSRWATRFLKFLSVRLRMCLRVVLVKTSTMSTKWCTLNSGKREKRPKKRPSLFKEMALA